MIKEQLEREFYNSFFNMEFDRAMQIVGAMNYANSPKTRYFEMLVYYEERKFDKIRMALKKEGLDLRERELYVCSLAELHLYSELQVELKKAQPVSVYCYYYLNYMLEEQGQGNLPEHDCIEVDDTYFQDRYKWLISKELASIYQINEAKIEMINAQMSENDIDYLQKKMLKKMEIIYIKDPFIEKINYAIKKNQHIELENILQFPIRYLGDYEKDGKPKLKHTFSCLYSILKYLEICMQINYNNIEKIMLVEYGTEIINSLKKGNAYTIDFLKRLYLNVEYFRRDILTQDGDTIADFIHRILEKNAPYVLSEILTHKADKRIETVLTTKGKFAYRAALWQFSNAVADDYGILDAGMLCLSYIRIIELEMNERIINPLRDNYYNEILEYYNELHSSVTEDKLEGLKENWEKCISILSPTGKNLELGSIFNILDRVRDKRFRKKSVSNKMSEFIVTRMQMILTQQGIDALKSGDLAKIIDPKIRENYRNPPAHTRYVNIDTALGCRKYVEEKLIELNRYILK